MNISKQIKIGFFLVVIMLFYNCSIQKNMINVTTVENLEIEKFMGTWYEIARFDHRFEKDLTGVSATYSIKEDGKIQVVNKGYLKNPGGKEKSITGKAKIPDLNDTGKLKVSFFWIFYSDYFVLELDEINYEWAVIGSSSPKYLWVLSREREMDAKLYKGLLQKISDRGYDISKLKMVPHKKAL